MASSRGQSANPKAKGDISQKRANPPATRLMPAMNTQKTAPPPEMGRARAMRPFFFTQISKEPCRRRSPGLLILGLLRQGFEAQDGLEVRAPGLFLAWLRIQRSMSLIELRSCEG